MLTLHRVEPITEIFGNPVNYPAHQADVIRLRMLKALGGIYLDLDVITLNPLEPLRSHSCVMGMEPGVGLCNAVILAEPNAPFIATWLEAYRDFDARQWNRHSVQRPWQLARQMPDAIRVEDPYAFFYPSHNDPVHRYLWGERPTAGALLARVAKNVVKGTLLRLGGCDDAARLWLYGNFHVVGLRAKTLASRIAVAKGLVQQGCAPGHGKLEVIVAVIECCAGRTAIP